MPSEQFHHASKPASHPLTLLGALAFSFATTASSYGSPAQPNKPLPAASQATSSVVSPALESALIAALEKSTRDRDETPKWITPSSVTSISLALVAMISLSFTIYQFTRNRKDSDEWKKRDLLASRRLKLTEVLPWFEQGESHRSAAIAIIEGHLEEHPELCVTWAAALSACCVKIVTKPDITLSPLDERDLHRMLSILGRMQRLLESQREAIYATTVEPVLSAVDDLASRVVSNSAGEQITPFRRQSFIQSIQYVLERHPKLVRK